MFFLRLSEFKKLFGLLSKRKQKRASERIDILRINAFDPILNNHALHGEYEGYRSINVAGNLRIIYKKLDDSTYILVNIGTHSQPYE